MLIKVGLRTLNIAIFDMHRNYTVCFYYIVQVIERYTIYMHTFSKRYKHTVLELILVVLYLDLLNR
jgi:hypothetical protein